MIATLEAALDLPTARAIRYSGDSTRQDTVD
jgi:hypothetical protein